MSNIRARQLLSNKSITIPTLPAVVQKVQTLLENPNTGAKELGDVVASDAPLAAKVLKIANSAYYGLRERCIARSTRAPCSACASCATSSRRRR